ncbi:TetR/AcrR family transcriptional regulator [Ktedonosporobacter rubrisoli]|uniref:TetR/AcrR family transcriptional regulator n=1 Tax=Ktedonosporobacter rubrisoli TaxID=2509675 RepID=A0A4P6JU18_KTERU|nr:TetR/AcrR family transcriptional regulator [Ktedonosporobacter rubrisoli]QBD78835.1 TetR/AcrR family transcriptional regulator [Ktedonosporobacter rubrisoli]
MSQEMRNVRVRRTQKLLREALVELIEERGFDALTIGELTQRAMVSRAAFYRNYQDKYDLVEQIFEEAMQPLMMAIGSAGPAQLQGHWVKLFAHLAEYDRLYRALLGGKGSFWLVTKMRTSLADMTKEHVHAQKGKGNRAFEEGFVPTLLSGLYVDAITWWLAQERPYPPEEMAQRCSLLASSLFKEASTWQ